MGEKTEFVERVVKATDSKPKVSLLKYWPIAAFLIAQLIGALIWGVRLQGVSAVNAGTLPTKADIAYVDSEIKQETLRREAGDDHTNQRLDNMDEDIQEIKADVKKINGGITQILIKLGN